MQQIIDNKTLTNRSENTGTGNFNIIIVKAILITLLVVTFFGTRLPFAPVSKDVDEIAGSNIVNQLVYSILFIASVLTLINKRRLVLLTIKNDKVFTLFLLWALLSVGWSQYSFVSFKRYFQFLTIVLASLTVVLNLESDEDILKMFQYILAAFIVISFISVFTIPGARDRFGVWRGLATHKNTLGEVCLISILVFGYSLLNSSFKQKLIYGSLLLMSLILIAGSRSVTSQLILMIAFVIVLIIFFSMQFKKIGVQNFLIVLIIFTGIVLLVSFLMFAPDLITAVLAPTGKDFTLTGRVPLWEDIFREAQTHLIIGCGFRGFWVIESPELLELFEVYVWLPMQAHNGYLDILNELGLIGITLFILSIINYFTKISNGPENHFFKWFVIVTIVMNLTESTFIQPQAVTGVLFTFSYVTLFGILAKREFAEQ